MEDLLRVGNIVTTHGIRGEVKVYPTTDDPARFNSLESVMLDTGSEMKALEITGVKYFKQYVILKFKGIDDINDIEKYRGRGLYVSRESAVKLEENEYFIADLIGLAVITDESRDLGKITDVLQTGANDVYCVRMEDERELLIPAIRECILNVDTESGVMKVHLLPGLLEE